MLQSILKYTIPVLKKGKKITSVPKGSTKAKEEAKQTWYIEYYFLHPEKQEKERIRQTHGLNRIKDPVKKLAAFTSLLHSYTKLLENGYNPFSDNQALKKTHVVLTLKEAQDEYLNYHISKSSRVRTITSFRSKTKMLVNYFGETTKVNQLTSIDVTNFMLSLEKEKQWSAKTFVNTSSALVNFF